ncbi:S-adenosyl-L-methionine-dependent methyltransferase [Byssothecium circinans]|uniref:S-adenosyl-L-methionine-dependent methyltransferase n=1 Tax=Byssothecium circinans TaxID=147558 RepID=A0A6A5UPE6_9PLEO|nr:S-adenosyl-L-methionine-dependent methyltransferase [Byssothecium circinans]
MPPPAWIADNMPTLLRPILLLVMAEYHFFMTILYVIFIDRNPSLLFHLTTLRHKAFARLWSSNGEAMSIEMPGAINELLSKSSGIVLDVGPGSGELLNRFNSSKIMAIYGAEPAVDLHPGLLENAQKAGFGDRYHALLCGGEPESLIPALHKSGILKVSGTGGTAEDGVFDEICCVRVLCGVPHPQQTIKGLYALLKPGGRMVICEHVVNPWRKQGSVLARIIQVVFTVLGWPFFLAGCELQRHTLEFLREAGEWQSFELEYVGEKSVVPFVVGELVKKV